MCRGLSAEVFAHLKYLLLLQDMFKAEPAWGREQELLSTSSMASSGTDGCVPELSHCSLPSIVVKSEACVPDYPGSCNGSPCMPLIHSDQVSSFSLPEPRPDTLCVASHPRMPGSLVSVGLL